MNERNILQIKNSEFGYTSSLEELKGYSPILEGGIFPEQVSLVKGMFKSIPSQQVARDIIAQRNLGFTVPLSYIDIANRRGVSFQRVGQIRKDLPENLRHFTEIDLQKRNKCIKELFNKKQSIEEISCVMGLKQDVIKLIVQPMIDRDHRQALDENKKIDTENLARVARGTLSPSKVVRVFNGNRTMVNRVGAFNRAEGFRLRAPRTSPENISSQIRVVLVMRSENVSIEEISEAMGLNKFTVADRLRAGRKLIRQMHDNEVPLEYIATQLGIDKVLLEKFY
jgi:hypothetical protein